MALGQGEEDMSDKPGSSTVLRICILLGYGEFRWIQYDPEGLDRAFEGHVPVYHIQAWGWSFLEYFGLK